MKISLTAIPDVLIVEPKVFSDDRGSFSEVFNAADFSSAVGREIVFVQDNESYSKQAVIRGLHYQLVRPQGKLVRVTYGEVFDVAVDIRRNSPTFGKWVGEKLSAENKKQLWIPEGFAHGFLVMSELAVFQYKVTDFRFPEHERVLRYNDPDLAINWPLVSYEFPIALGEILSEKDQLGLSLTEADLFN